jgi:hypothetical protein
MFRQLIHSLTDQSTEKVYETHLARKAIFTLPLGLPTSEMRNLYYFLVVKKTWQEDNWAHSKLYSKTTVRREWSTS